MTDLATALADNAALTPYQGKDVLRTSIAIRNAGDGLSEALAIDPVVLPIGSKGVLVLEYEVKAHDYERIPDTNALMLKQVLKAGTATLIDADVVRDALTAQREKIDKAKADASGQPRLIDTSGAVTPDGDVRTTVNEHGDEEPVDEVMLRQHAQGVHADGLRDECPACQREVEAVKAEAADEVGAKRRSRKAKDTPQA